MNLYECEASPCERLLDAPGLCQPHADEARLLAIGAFKSRERRPRCSVADEDVQCPRSAVVGGMCVSHHYRNWKFLHPLSGPEIPPQGKGGPCQVYVGSRPCGKPINSLGMCSAHYSRYRIYNDPLGGVYGSLTKDDVEEILRRRDEPDVDSRNHVLAEQFGVSVRTIIRVKKHG